MVGIFIHMLNKTCVLYPSSLWKTLTLYNVIYSIDRRVTLFVHFDVTNICQSCVAGDFIPILLPIETCNNSDPCSDTGFDSFKIRLISNILDVFVTKQLLNNFS